MCAFIDAYKDKSGVEPICRVLTELGTKISPSTYYDARSRPPSARDTETRNSNWRSSRYMRRTTQSTERTRCGWHCDVAAHTLHAAPSNARCMYSGFAVCSAVPARALPSRTRRRTSSAATSNRWPRTRSGLPISPPRDGGVGVRGVHHRWAGSIPGGEPTPGHTDDPHPVESSDGPRFEIGAEGNNQARLLTELKQQIS